MLFFRKSLGEFWESFLMSSKLTLGIVGTTIENSVSSLSWYKISSALGADA